MVFQLGGNIVDFFEDSSRGANQGRNDNGVEIEYIGLSMEPFGEDRSTINLSVNNGLSLWGLDAAADRSQPRESFSVFSGFSADTPPGALSFADRRRIVVVDATSGSQLITQHNDIPLSSGALDTNLVNLIRTAINTAEPAPEGVDYAAWVSEELEGSDETDFNDDPDGDGWVNGMEFAAGTSPLDSNSVPLLEFEATGTGFLYSYQRATDRVGITRGLQTGLLDSLAVFEPNEEDVTTEPMGEGIEKVTLNLSADFGPFLRQQVLLDS